MQNENESVVIDSLDMFAAVVAKWHQSCIRELQYTLKVPEGTELCIDEENPIALEGELLKGYLLGIQTAIVCIGKLPFFEDVESANDQSMGVQSELNSNAVH